MSCLLLLFSINILFCKQDESISPLIDTSNPKPNKVGHISSYPPSGTYNHNQNIYLSSETSHTDIYYTIDGSTPSKNNGTLYTPNEPIFLEGHGSALYLKVIAYKDGLEPSEIKFYNYTLNFHNSSSVIFSHKNGTYSEQQLLKMISLDDDSSIYYTLDGSIPNQTSLLYTEPILLNNNAQYIIRAINYTTGYLPSSIKTLNLHIEYTRTPPVIFSEGAGQKSRDITLHLSSSTEGSLIYYTTDGTIPNHNSTAYTSPIFIAGNNTLTQVQAIAIKEGLANSIVTSKTYRIQYNQASEPTSTPASGIFTLNTPIVLQSIDQDAKIYYTTNLEEPTTSSNLYSNPILIENEAELFQSQSVLIIKAFAEKAGLLPSEVKTFIFVLSFPVVEPVFFLNNTNMQIITNSESTIALEIKLESVNGESIYYTLDGTEPTQNNGFLYSTPLVFNEDNKDYNLKARAYKVGNFTPSRVTSLPIRINYPDVSAINITPNGGLYQQPTQITLSTTTPSAQIYYTLDGTEPTIHSNLYHTPFTLNEVNKTMQIRAKGLRLQFTESIITEQYFTISPPFIETSYYAEDYETIFIHDTFHTELGNQYYYTLGSSFLDVNNIPSDTTAPIPETPTLLHLNSNAILQNKYRLTSVNYNFTPSQVTQDIHSNFFWGLSTIESEVVFHDEVQHMMNNINLTLLGNQDLLLLKIHPTTGYVWHTNIGGHNLNIKVLDMIIDSHDNIYCIVNITGSIGDTFLTHTLTLENNISILKINPVNGSILWSKLIPINNITTVNKVLHLNNYIYLTGNTQSSTLNTLSLIGNQDAFLTKVDLNGNIIWNQNIGRLNTAVEITSSLINNNKITLYGNSNFDILDISNEEVNKYIWRYSFNENGTVHESYINTLATNINIQQWIFMPNINKHIALFHTNDTNYHQNLLGLQDMGWQKFDSTLNFIAHKQIGAINANINPIYTHFKNSTNDIQTIVTSNTNILGSSLLDSTGIFFIR